MESERDRRYRLHIEKQQRKAANKKIPKKKIDCNINYYAHKRV